MPVRNRALVVATFALATLLQAQEAPQLELEHLRGEVLREDGSPWAGAVVVARGQLHDAPETWRQLVRLEFTCDGQGRFRGRVPRSHRWQLWASEPREDGRVRATTVVIADSGNLHLELKAKNEPIPARAVLDVPEEVGGVAVQTLLLGWAHGAVREAFVPDANRRVTLPGICAAGAYVELLDEEDRVLAKHFVRKAAKQEAADAAAKQQAATKDGAKETDAGTEVPLEVELSWPEPETVPVLLLVHHGEKPIAGARVFGLQPTAGPLAGVTDAEGRVVLDFPVSSNAKKNGQQIWARWRIVAPGYAECSIDPQLQILPQKEKDKEKDAAGAVEGETAPNPAQKAVQAVKKLVRAAPRQQGALELEFGRDRTALRQAEAPDLSIDLAAAAEMRGRLWLTEGVPAANVPLHLDAALPQGNQNMQVHIHWGGRGTRTGTRTGEDGSFALRTLGNDEKLQLRALLAPEQLARVSARLDCTVNPEAFVFVGDWKGAAAGSEALDIRLDQLVLLELSVRRASGLPARNASMLLQADGQDRRSGQDDSRRYALGRRGDLALLCPPGTTFEVAILESDELLHAQISAGDKPGARVAAPLQLAAPVWIPGRVQNLQGQPLAGVQIQSSPISAIPSLLRQLLARSVKSDAEGRFRLPAVKDSRLYVHAWHFVETQGQRRAVSMQQPIQIEVGDVAPPEIQIDLDVPAPAEDEAKKEPAGDK